MPWSSSTRLIVRPTGADPVSLAIPAPGRYVLGGIEIIVAGSDGEVRWSIENASRLDLALDAVALAWDAGPAGDDPRCFCHGYQSWAATRTRRLGRDADPSCHPESIPLVRAAYHADPARAAAGELRSEQVTVLKLGSPDLVCIGFDGGERHAGTLRMQIVDGRVEVRAEAWLGGAVLPSGRRRELHGVDIRIGDDAPSLLDEWASAVGRRAGARVRAPYQVGWCSWYHYFHSIDERALRANLTLAGTWPFDVFQLDDGYQAAIGDWLVTTDAFPSGIDGVASAIASEGRQPGIWIAPFLAAPGSECASRHPEWLAFDPRTDRPAVGMVHEVWGGIMWQLDTTRPDVREHLAALARDLVAAGYRYLKLDFTFSAAVPARVHDPTLTPAERVRAGYDAIRAGAGDDVFVLGCGCPLGPVVGVVDAMRIGADVAPWWDPPAESPGLAGYEDAAPATRHAFTNTLTRAFQHRRLWLNDPDCLMLRTRETALAPEAARAWAMTVAYSGGLALVSDDLALLDADARALLDEVVAIGRVVDAASIRGRPPRCADILESTDATTLTTTRGTLVVDPHHHG